METQEESEHLLETLDNLDSVKILEIAIGKGAAFVMTPFFPFLMYKTSSVVIPVSRTRETQRHMA